VSIPRPFDYHYLRPPDRLDVYHATLLEETSDHIIVTHTVAHQAPVLHRGVEILQDGSSIVWFLFKNRRYDVGRFYLRDGTWTGFYSDITEPVRWKGSDASTLETVTDLFLDVWISPDGEIEVLDADELADALVSGWITEAQAEQARSSADEIVNAFAAGMFPPLPALHWKSS
jgi:predicted RNA-binding protein associated with RNAse of E/G family